MHNRVSVSQGLLTEAHQRWRTALLQLLSHNLEEINRAKLNIRSNDR